MTPSYEVGRVLDLRVTADPESCQTTATQLARLGEVCGLVAPRLRAQATVAEDELGGLSGIVYRRSTADLAVLAHRLAANSARLADGLGGYARDIAEVRRLMGEALTAAAPHLRTTSETVWSPDRPPDLTDPDLVAAWAAWHAAVDWWRRARALQDAAEQAWKQAILRPLPDEPVDYDSDGHPPPLPDRDPARDRP